MSVDTRELYHAVDKLSAELSQLVDLMPNRLQQIMAQSVVQRWLALQVAIIQELEKANREN